MKQLVFLFVLTAFTSFGQTPYTVTEFPIDSLMDVTYGTAVDYAGNTVDLKMDIFKPVGDNNCLRPVMVLVHGGAWVGGSKDDPYMVYMSRELARKGWVVANINYRLGTHKAADYTMYGLCNTTLSQPCGYICDSSEMYRANFRGMQDAKGAIRFMKDRHAIDSSDIGNVFIAGESAGGFIALAAAFTDQASEKPANCFAIANAPTPDPDLAMYGCIPASNNLARPDLGSIAGSLNTGTHDATVKGVASYYGAVNDLNIFNQVADTPDVYLFHQGSDIIVNYSTGNILGRTSWECYAQTNICQSYYFYPIAHGGEKISEYFTGLGAAAPTFTAGIVYNYEYMNNCFSNGHSIDNVQTRMQHMTDFFADKIAASGNDPDANCVNGLAETAEETFTVFPNPASDAIMVSVQAMNLGSAYMLVDLTGRTVLSGVLSETTTAIPIGLLKNGTYVLTIGNSSQKVVVKH
jgi:acetyl esterase/lipase